MQKFNWSNTSSDNTWNQMKAKVCTVLHVLFPKVFTNNLSSFKTVCEQINDKLLHRFCMYTYCLSESVPLVNLLFLV